jgi:hypothetical protein
LEYLSIVLIIQRFRFVPLFLTPDTFERDDISAFSTKVVTTDLSKIIVAFPIQVPKEVHHSE